MPLNADQRGGTGPNGKPSFTVEQAAANLLREDAAWFKQPGQTLVLNYAFRTVAPGSMPSDTTGFSAFNDAQIAAAERALLAWSDIADIRFQRVGEFDVNATILFGNYSSGEEGAAAFAYYPGSRTSSAQAGDVWIRWPSATNADLGRGGQGDYILVHEIGHALGLAHPGGYDAEDLGESDYTRDAIYYEDSRVYTVMSYFGSVNTGTTTSIFANAPQLDDVAAIQRLYGANNATRAGNTVYGFNSNTDRSWYTLKSAEDAIYTSIWDGGGTDTLDMSGYGQNQRIDLRQGAFSDVGPSIGSLTIAMGAVIENAVGGSGQDYIGGNAARNQLFGLDGADTLHGLAGDDVLVGGTENDLAYGGDGADLIGGQDGDDYLEGGAGADVLLGEAGNDALVGGGGADNLNGHDGDDLMGGQDGDDYLGGGAGADTMLGEAGADVLVGGGGADRLTGHDGDDLIGGQDGDDYLAGDAGADTLLGEAGADVLVGGSGDDRLYAHDGDDLLGGQDGDDYLAGDAGADVLLGEAGADVLVGGSGDDQLFGHDGDDLMGGQDGADQLDGGAGLDTLLGEAGDDVLFGGSGADVLFAGDGADRLFGGADRDSLFGQGGADIFDFAAGGEGDIVGDFSAFEGDRIALGGAQFTALALADVDGDGRQDSQLTFAGGSIMFLGVSDLGLDGWNGLVI